MPSPTLDRVTFRAGFVSEVRCSYDEWMIHGPAAVAAQPVERVTPTDKRPFTGSVAALPRPPLLAHPPVDQPRRVVPGAGRLRPAAADTLAAPRNADVWRDYASHRQAMDAYSTAVLAYARMTARATGVAPAATR